MQQQQLVWPTKAEYDLAMTDWVHTIQDPALRQGVLLRDSYGPRSMGGANLYVCVYRIDNWLIRCFRATPPKRYPPDDIVERYQHIEQFCRDSAAKLPALVPVRVQANGIRVGTRMLPIVTMPYVLNSTALGHYVEVYHNDTQRMQELTLAWQELIARMEAIPMAHGDLDLTNVLVEESGQGVRLRLVDYDNIWIPALRGRTQTEGGHEHFQHPAFLPPRQRPYDQTMDRFSALTIFISLQAIALNPGLYDDWEADETSFLLLLSADYQDPTRADGRIAALERFPALRPYIVELRACLREARMPKSLIAIAADADLADAGVLPESPQATPSPLVATRRPLSLTPPRPGGDIILMGRQPSPIAPGSPYASQMGEHAPVPPPPPVRRSPPPPITRPSRPWMGLDMGTISTIIIVILVTLAVLFIIVANAHG